jgi:threonine efflux protein
MSIFLQLGAGFLIGFVAAVVPGPDTILVLRSVAAGGGRAGARAAFGIGAALTVHAAITIAIVGTLRHVAASPVLKAIQLAGIVYLAYMGAALLRTSLVRPGDTEQVDQAGQAADHYFLQGFITNLTNPKAIIFFTSIVSQFITSRDGSSGVAVLTGVVAAVPAWFFLISYFSARVMAQLTTRSRRVVDMAAGFLFLGLACVSGVSAFLGWGV